ncbi:MAG: NAD(P)-binding domain-containing protein [Planctomycetota bacterium]
MRIGFIGLGIMGKPMAKNLLAAGHALVVHNRSQDAVDELVAAGATAAGSPAEVAAQTELVLTMLPDSPDVEAVALGADGIAAGAKPGATYVDMSSIAPLVAQDVGARLAAQEVTMIDAPVSGGEEKAKSGQLAFMVGGPDAAVAAVRPVLEVMGASVTHVGALGAGNSTKLVNQCIVAVNIAVVAEALSLGKRLGVDPARITEAIRGGLAGSACLNDKAPRMLQGEYAPGFKMKLHAKDLANVFATSRSTHVHMPLTAQVHEMMQGLLAAGREELDHGGLALHYETVNHLSLAADGANDAT